jgi:hypothetical protein
MGFLLGLNAIFWIAGFLFPVPCFIMACRGWIKTRNIPPAKSWRRKVSQIALCLLALGLGLWIYALLRGWRGDDILYNALTAKVGRWGSASMIIPCALAESKVRIYLLLGAFGLLFFFGVSLGEMAI